MRWWRCSAALISSVSVISALWMNIKTTTQLQLQQKGLRGRESSGWGDKQSSRDSRTERKTWSCFNRRRRPSMALLIKQWRTVRGSSLRWSVCWRREALMWSSRSDPSSKLKWARVRELQERLEQEITELKRRDHELKQLSDTEDHNQFLLNYPSLSPHSESTHSSSFRIRPLRYFEDVTAAVSQVRGRLQDILSETETETLQIVSQVDVLLPQPEPRDQSWLLKIFTGNHTGSKHSKQTSVIIWGKQKSNIYEWSTVLFWSPRQIHWSGLRSWVERVWLTVVTGRWRWGGEEKLDVSVSQKNISRAGTTLECVFGYNDKSWKLLCCPKPLYILLQGDPTLHRQVLGPPESECTWITVQVFCPSTASLTPWLSSTESRPHSLCLCMLELRFGRMEPQPSSVNSNSVTSLTNTWGGGWISLSKNSDNQWTQPENSFTVHFLILAVCHLTHSLFPACCSGKKIWAVCYSRV